MNARKSLTKRKLFSIPKNPVRSSKNKFSGAFKKLEDIAKLVKYIDDNVIGKNTTFVGPFGRRRVVYCDYASSGHSLQFIENFILREVLPNFGNSRSTASNTSLQSALFRQEAKEIIRLCVNATDEDTVIFIGLGCRGPISKLLQELHFREPPVVFVGPCEHQSALLPWKELGAKIVRISECKRGYLDLNGLETQLRAHANGGAQLIGCFSAANNITGTWADDIATTLLLHQYGALAFWDYSAAAPYVQLDMNLSFPGFEETALHKDVMFFSVHKFIGGAQTPGILIVKKSVLKNSTSCVCSPIFDEDDNEHCASDIDLHDDRGTVTIVEDVRAGLVLHLKETVGVSTIMTRKDKITRTVLAHVKNVPEFILLGDSSCNLKRLPFFSFIVRHPRGIFLHHNFVCSILNDVFGIQSCASADPYSKDYLGIDEKLAEEYERILLRHSFNVDFRDSEGFSELEILRPGFTRISLPFCITDAELGFILEALKMVATEGWKLLPQYAFKPETGEWRHHSSPILKDRKWLMSLKYVDLPERKVSVQETCPTDYEECLQMAKGIFNRARKMIQRYPPTAQKFSFDEEAEPLRWFMLPSEAHDLLIGNSQNVKHKIPFDPLKFKGCKGDPFEVNIYKGEEKLNKCTSSLEEPKNILTAPNVLECNSGGNTFSDPESYANPPPNIQNNFAPNVPSYLFQERQNSFSSELSNCDYLDSSGYQTQCYSNAVPYTASSQSPAVNSLDVFCYSPQPMMPSPLPNQMDLNAQFYQTNYMPIHLNNYVTHCVNNEYDSSTCSDQMENGMMNTMNYGQMNSNSDSHSANNIRFLLGANKTSTRHRCNSVGSSLVMNPNFQGNQGFSYQSLPDGEISLNLSECHLNSDENIHAYVTEVTKELATEIKSEIREVISKVEDVLSETGDADSSNYHLEHRNSRCFEKLERTNSLPSASANDIAQYLMGVSKEMAEEMKSEIRGLVSSVVSPESSPMLDKKTKKIIEPRSKIKKEEEEEDTKSEKADESNVNVSESGDSRITMNCSETNTDSKVKDKEVSDDLVGNKENSALMRDRSEFLGSLRENGSFRDTAKNDFPKRKISRATKKIEKCLFNNAGEGSNYEGPNAEEAVKPRWCCPSKAVWKPTVEAFKEFEMIKNGDKILVYLPGGVNSLAVLHILQQYRFYTSSRGIHFEFGAVAFDPNCENSNAKSLIPYLNGLGVPHYHEELTVKDNDNTTKAEMSKVCSSCRKLKKSQLYAVASKRGYNVIALAQTLDDFAESFLMSAFHNGKMRSMKAHYHVPDKNIRVIRPFVYVRDKVLRQFAESRNLPSMPKNCTACKTTSKERQRCKQLLSLQESVYPRLFNSLKSALHPFIRGDNCSGEDDGSYKTESHDTTSP